MSGFARCVHGWISLPLMYLCFRKPLPWCFRGRVPPGLPLLLDAPCWQGSHPLSDWVTTGASWHPGRVPLL